MSAPSARGLFRATGKVSKPVHAYDEAGVIVKVAARPRQEDDFEPTPPEPTRAFLAHEGVRLREFGLVWEPAAGNGAMVRELATAGLDVVASDLVDRGCESDVEIRSFYDFDRAPCRAIVTNPPFADCQARASLRWLRHALDNLAVEYMALLLPWSWPSPGGMASFWEEHPPGRVYLMRWRIDFTGMGANPSNHAWWVWDRAWKDETVLRMMDRIDTRQGSMFGEAA